MGASGWATGAVRGGVAGGDRCGVRGVQIRGPGETDGGAPIAPNDPNWDRLTTVAQAARQDPSRWLAMEDIYGATGRDPAVIGAFDVALRDLWAIGTAAVLADFIAD